MLNSSVKITSCLHRRLKNRLGDLKEKSTLLVLQTAALGWASPEEDPKTSLFESEFRTNLHGSGMDGRRRSVY